jgi:REP element-mobilizing transposase RayT
MAPSPSDPDNSGAWHSRGYLPHFESQVHTQHVTVHLSDSLPQSAIDRIDQVIQSLPDEARAIERRKRLHAWIDAGYGSCILKEPALAQIVEGAFHFFDGKRYRLYAWVVMPNHFHVLFQPMAKWTMAETLASWKKYTSTEIKKWLRANAEIRAPGNATHLSCPTQGTAANAEIRAPGNTTHLSCPTQGTSTPDLIAAVNAFNQAPLWHPEYWDRYIRNEKHFHDVIAYIEQNPFNAGLCVTPSQWRFSSAYQS